MGELAQEVSVDRPLGQVDAMVDAMVDVAEVSFGVGLVQPGPASRRYGPGDGLGSVADARRRRVQLLKLGLVAADVAAVGFAMAMASSLHGLLPREETLATARQLRVGVLSLPMWVAFFLHYRLYSARHVASRLSEFRRLVHAAGASVMATAGAAFMLRLYVPRSWLVMTFLLSVVVLTASRDLVRRSFEFQRRRGRLQRAVVIVGANREGRELAAMLAESPGVSNRVVGFVDDDVPTGACVDGIPVLGSVAQTATVVGERKVSGVLIATTALGLQESSRLAFELTAAKIHVEVSTGMCDIALERLTVQRVGRLSVIYVEPVQLGGWHGSAKRAFDIAVAGVGLVLAAPILLLGVIAVKLDSPGSALFRQRRLGLDGRPFEILKLRTMVRDAETLIVDLRAHNEAGGPLFKMRNDPRITRAGRRLRQFSIDEIPQLWNVLRGEMSLVGPRPALPEEVEGWSAELHGRLLVRPGITGMWQVSGRTDASFEEYTRLDLYYVRNWSLLTDLAMLAKTVPAVLSRRGAC